MAKKKKKPETKTVRRNFYIELPLDVFVAPANEIEPDQHDIADWLTMVIRLDGSGIGGAPWYALSKEGLTVWKSLGDLVEDKPLDAMGT